ncbi:unannotated protein [freshwater metagenome]|uniref:Unannotated protein n=1 Tax=freshwater metagenome TaxID=449393 RepID=A0A6J6BNY3_9ZZZZ
MAAHANVPTQATTATTNRHGLRLPRPRVLEHQPRGMTPTPHAHREAMVVAARPRLATPAQESPEQCAALLAPQQLRHANPEPDHRGPHRGRGGLPRQTQRHLQPTAYAQGSAYLCQKVQMYDVELGRALRAATSHPWHKKSCDQLNRPNAANRLLVHSPFAQQWLLAPATPVDPWPDRSPSATHRAHQANALRHQRCRRAEYRQSMKPRRHEGQ